MTVDWASMVITGTTTAVTDAKGILTALSQQANADSGILGVLRGLFQGIIPALYPAGIAISALFGGYFLIKAFYHRRF